MRENFPKKNSLERHRIARGWFAMVSQVRNDNRPPVKTILVCMLSARITLIYFVSVKWWICFPREVKFSFLPNRPCWRGEIRFYLKVRHHLTCVWAGRDSSFHYPGHNGAELVLQYNISFLLKHQVQEKNWTWIMSGGWRWVWLVFS